MKTTETMKSSFGLVGIVAGVVALGLTFVHFWAGPFNPKPPVEEVVVEKVVNIRNDIARQTGQTIYRVKRGLLDHYLRHQLKSPSIRMKFA